MSWINNIVTPKIKEILTKKDVPDNLWIKCPESGQMVFHKDLEANQWVVPGSNYHMKISAKKRLDLLYDNEYSVIGSDVDISDPLKFKDEKRYIDRLKDARKKEAFLFNSDVISSAYSAVLLNTPSPIMGLLG